MPITLREARRFVAEHHRHNEPDRGWRFGVGLEQDGELVAVGTAGRPKGRGLDDGHTIEITRCCTLGTTNAASRVYGALCRAATALGYDRAVTYTLASEPGSSLLASGFERDADLGERESWDYSGQGRYQDSLLGPRRPAEAKVRWKRNLHGGGSDGRQPSRAASPR